jgi:hypothetical protein
VRISLVDPLAKIEREAHFDAHRSLFEIHRLFDLRAKKLERALDPIASSHAKRLAPRIDERLQALRQERSNAPSLVRAAPPVVVLEVIRIVATPLAILSHARPSTSF